MIGPVLIGLAGSVAAQSGSSPRTPVRADIPLDLALTGVTIVDVESGRLLPNRTVLIAGDRIVRVSVGRDERIPASAQIVGAEGKYLIPGLIDTHVHRWWASGEAKDTVPLFSWLIANGITGMRETSGAGRERELVRLREEAKRGEVIAPRLYVSGSASMSNVQRYGAASLLDLVRQFAAFGVNGIKLIHLTREETLATIAEARRLRLPAYGHVHLIGRLQRPELPFGFHGFGPDAIQSGVSGIMHVASLTPASSRLPANEPADLDAWWVEVLGEWLSSDGGWKQSLIDSMVARGIWLEPTLVATDLYARPERYRYHPGEAYLGQSALEWNGWTRSAAEVVNNTAALWQVSRRLSMTSTRLEGSCSQVQTTIPSWRLGCTTSCSSWSRQVFLPSLR